MKLPNNRKLRIIIDSIVLNTTKGKIVDLFANPTQRQAVLDTLQELENMLATTTARSLSQNIHTFSVQVDLV